MSVELAGLLGHLMLDALVDGDFHAVDVAAEPGGTLREHVDVVAGPHGWRLIAR